MSAAAPRSCQRSCSLLSRRAPPRRLPSLREPPREGRRRKGGGRVARLEGRGARRGRCFRRRGRGGEVHRSIADRVPLSAVSSSPVTQTAAVPPVPTITPSDVPSAEPPAARVAIPSAKAHAPTARPVPGDPNEERVLVDTARTALARGREADALTAIEEHARQFPRGRLAEERGPRGSSGGSHRRSRGCADDGGAIPPGVSEQYLRLRGGPGGVALRRESGRGAMRHR
jgi:hypothetical protein